MSVLTLFDYGPSANCLKVRILLRQLGLEHERVDVDIFAGESQRAEYLLRQPCGADTGAAARRTAARLPSERDPARIWPRDRRPAAAPSNAPTSTRLSSAEPVGAERRLGAVLALTGRESLQPGDASAARRARMPSHPRSRAHGREFLVDGRCTVADSRSATDTTAPTTRHRLVGRPGDRPRGSSRRGHERFVTTSSPTRGARARAELRRGASAGVLGRLRRVRAGARSRRVHRRRA